MPKTLNINQRNLLFDHLHWQTLKLSMFNINNIFLRSLRI